MYRAKKLLVVGSGGVHNRASAFFCTTPDFKNLTIYYNNGNFIIERAPHV